MFQYPIEAFMYKTSVKNNKSEEWKNGRLHYAKF